MKGFLCSAILLMLRYEATCSTENCARLKFVNLTGNILRAVENEFINITFSVSSENCSRDHEYLVKVSRLRENNQIIDLCKIMCKNSMCNVSQSTTSCRIGSSGNEIEFSGQVKSSDTAFRFSLSVDDLSKQINTNISISQFSSNSSAERDTATTPTTITTGEQQTSSTTSKPDPRSIHTKDLWISLIVSVLILVIALIIFFSVYWLTSRARRSEVDLSKVRQFVRMSSDVSGSWNYCKWRRILRTEGGLWEFSRLHELLGLRGDYSNVADDLESPMVSGRVGSDGFYETLDSETEVRNEISKISASVAAPRFLNDATHQRESSTDCSPDNLYSKTNDLLFTKDQVTRSDDYNHLGEILERKESQTDPGAGPDDYVSIRKIRERKALKGLTSVPVTAPDDYISIRKIRERKEARKAAAADNSGDDYVPITDICERKRNAKGDMLDDTYVSISDIKSRKKIKQAGLTSASVTCPDDYIFIEKIRRAPSSDAGKRLGKTERTADALKVQVTEDTVDVTDASPDDSATCLTSMDDASKCVSTVFLDTSGQCVTVDFSPDTLQTRL